MSHRLPAMRRSIDERSPLMQTQRPSPNRSYIYTKERLERINCFSLVWRIKRDVEALCDTPLNVKELESPKLVFLLQPLQDRYNELDCIALVYCLLVCRIHFLEQQSTPSAYSLSYTRAALCEILATKAFRRISDEDPDSDDTMLKMAHALNGAFSPFQGASDDVLAYFETVASEDGYLAAPKGNALELAIIGNAARFINSPPVQRVVDAIWSGEIIYSPQSFIDLLPDHYRRKPITLYDPMAAPILDHHRLMVPKIRLALEFVHFVILFASYLAVVFTMKPDKINGWEIWLAIYASGFALDKFASVLEHGFSVFIQNLWNGIDIAFIGLFCVYLVLRILDVRDASTRLYYVQSLDVLACGAILLFPRLCFLFVSKSPMILGLRAMFKRFVVLLALSLWSLLGFWLTFWLMGGGRYTPMRILKYMVYLTWGVNSTPHEEAVNFSPILGPILFFVYACLSSVLVLAVIISVLSHTFRQEADDTAAIVNFKHAVDTLEGAKSDSAFLYQPPFNILAFIVLFPTYWLVSQKTFHTITVYASCTLNAPLLLVICAWEKRASLFGQGKYSRVQRWIQRVLISTTAHQPLKIVFDLPPDLIDDIPQNGPASAFETDSDGGSVRRGRTKSPVRRRRGEEGSALKHRDGSRPSPLTRMYGKNSEDVESLVKRMERIEGVLARIEEGIKTIG